VGIVFQKFQLQDSIKIEGLKKAIIKISDKSDGVVIQVPLPKHLKTHTQEILNCIPPEKDPDVLTETNLGKFCGGNFTLMPPTVMATKLIFEEYNIKLLGKDVALYGAGKLVGVPMAIWFLKENASITTIHKYTKKKTTDAEIIISGVGKPGLVKGDMVRCGVIAIDLGFSIVNNKIKGDIDESVKAKYLTPVPGGIGKLMIACLLLNLTKLCKL
jgi:methylenetetrahydrofolate dehydrogenase (NADP+)/methenyltetrahydrofolate cyclohydrolase